MSGASSFIGAARRDQLVASAIALIAEVGLERASTVRIARHAGISRGVLTHHFRDRDDLLEAVVAEVYAVARVGLEPLVKAAPTPRDALTTFVAGSIDFYASHPDHMATLSEVFAADRRADGAARRRDPRHMRELDDIVGLLEAGQAAGQLRAFDAPTMAGVIRAALDSALHQVRAGADVALLRRELVETIDIAIRRSQ